VKSNGKVNLLLLAHPGKLALQGLGVVEPQNVVLDLLPPPVKDARGNVGLEAGAQIPGTPFGGERVLGPGLAQRSLGPLQFAPGRLHFLFGLPDLLSVAGLHPVALGVRPGAVFLFPDSPPHAVAGDGWQRGGA